MTIKFKRLSENAVAPVKAHATDAGFDLTSTRVTTEVNERGQILLVYHTDIAVEIPEGYFGALVSRSSIASKTLTLTNCIGTIDAGYRGEIVAKMRTTTDVVPAVYKEGERFAQLLILPVPEVQFEESDTLSESDRNDGGFGSTGNEQSAPTGPQSPSKDEDESINSEAATDGSGGEQNIPEQA